MGLGTLWSTGIEDPLLNLVVGLTALTGGSFGAGLLAFTVIARGATFPLTLRGLRASQRMRDLQPQLKELKKRHSNPSERSRAQMELMRAHGVHPLSSVFPQLLQMPLFIAMNRVVRLAVGSGSGTGVASRLYPVPGLSAALPLHSRFLFLDLGQRGGVLLAVAVLMLMLSQAWLSMIEGPADAGAGRWTIGLTMPTVFAAFVFAAPAGLGLYWATSIIAGLALQEVFFYRGRRIRRIAGGGGPGRWGTQSPAAAVVDASPSTSSAPKAVSSRPGPPSRARSRPRRRAQKRRRR